MAKDYRKRKKKTQAFAREIRKEFSFFLSIRCSVSVSSLWVISSPSTLSPTTLRFLFCLVSF